jgi:hypothetical protein
MTQANDMEARLWNYIDGNCTADDAAAISILIQQDKAWQNAYHQLLAFQFAMQTELETEHPSMRFTQNVMDKIETLEPAHTLRTIINIWVIRAIASVLVVSTLVGMLVLLKNDNQPSSATASILPKWNFTFSIDNYINSNAALSCAGFVTIISLLILIDRYRSYRLQIDAGKK